MKTSFSRSKDMKEDPKLTSLKVIGTDLYSASDFIVIFYRNVMSILYHFRETVN